MNLLPRATTASSRRSAVALAALFTILPPAARAAAAATTFVQGSTITDTGKRPTQLTVSFDVATGPESEVANGGFFVNDGLLAGSRDRIRMMGAGTVADFAGPTFYGGVTPVLDQEELVVEDASLIRWADLINDGTLDGDATIDENTGQVFGEVRDASGAIVVGATVSISPGAGDVHYFGDSGDPDLDATGVGATGRFLILNVPPGTVGITAVVPPPPGPAGVDGKVVPIVIGKVYGVVIKGTLSGLSPTPLTTVSGVAWDQTGAGGGGTLQPIPGALIEWDFNTDFADIADPDGSFSVPDVVARLDATLRGTAAGYRPALTFRKAVEELPQSGAMASVRLQDVGFLSDSAYASYPAAFGVEQPPSLGVVFGRVRGKDGTPLAGATVSLDPDVGVVKYFDSAGMPAPSLVQTSGSGLFIVFRVPVGNVVLSAVGPGETIHSEVAPSQAGAVTFGELSGVPTISVRGRVVDELSQTNTLAGSVVSVVEYPYLATISTSDGEYFLPGVPAGELLTFRAGHAGFKDSYTFLEPTPATDIECSCPDMGCACLASSDSSCSHTCVGGAQEGSHCSQDSDCGTGGTCENTDPCCLPNCSEGKKLLAISDISFNNLHREARTAANRSRGVVAGAVLFSNDNAALGLKGQLTPDSAAARYPPDLRLGDKFINTNGTLQVVNAAPGVSGLSLHDDRNDQASLTLLRIFEDSVTINERLKPDCDNGVVGSFGNIYPCNGSRLSALVKNLFFQWRLGSNVRAQVQISADPSFGTIAVTSIAEGKKLLPRDRVHWIADAKKVKKIKKLGGSGAAVYWRVLAVDDDGNESTSEPYVFYLH